jgi:hypothetical protein
MGPAEPARRVTVSGHKVIYFTPASFSDVPRIIREQLTMVVPDSGNPAHQSSWTTRYSRRCKRILPVSLGQAAKFRPLHVGEDWLDNEAAHLQ